MGNSKPKYPIGTKVMGEMFLPDTLRVEQQTGIVVSVQGRLYHVRCEGEIWATSEQRLKKVREVIEGWEPKESR
jgi:hypothetical protein